jgi:hypothetical protein
VTTKSHTGGGHGGRGLHRQQVRCAVHGGKRCHSGGTLPFTLTLTPSPREAAWHPPSHACQSSPRSNFPESLPWLCAAACCTSTRSTYSDENLRIVTIEISGGRSLTGPFRDARRFPSTRSYPVPRATRTTLGFCIRPSFKDHSLSRRAKS